MLRDDVHLHVDGTNPRGAGLQRTWMRVLAEDTIGHIGELAGRCRCGVGVARVLRPRRAGRRGCRTIRGDGRGGRRRHRTVHFNPDLKTSTVMVPGLIGLILTFIGTTVTSIGSCASANPARSSSWR